MTAPWRSPGVKAFAGIGEVRCEDGDCRVYCGRCATINPVVEVKPALGPRADWDHVFMALARAIATRSKDETTRVGAVIVATDNQPIGMGFNGFPKGAPDADLPAGGKARHLWVVHAEENAVLTAMANSPARVRGARAYTTHRPCARCLRLLTHVGVTEICWGVDELSLEQSREAGEIAGVMGVRDRRFAE